MSETANSTAPSGAPANTGAPTTGQPAAFQVPEGHRLVPNSEWEAHSRNTERLKGMDGFYKKASALGFKSDKDFETWEPAFKAFQKRGVKPDLLARTFGEDVSEDLRGGEPRQQPSFDPNEFKESFKNELRKETALERWRVGRESEPDLIEKTIESLKADAPFGGSFLKRAVMNALDESRGLYPEGHPLANEVLPHLTEKNVKAVVEMFKKEWAEDKAKQVTSAADKFKNAQNKAPTVAGPATRQGKPDTQTHTRPGGKPSIEDAMAAAEAKMLSRRR